jgi:putative oxidoreductase
VFSALLFHADFSNHAKMINFIKSVSTEGSFLLLIVHGLGAYALGHRVNFS